MMITKCMYCARTFNKLSDIGSHIENKHNDLLPDNLSGSQLYVIEKTGKTHGSCVMCKQNTLWNVKTNKYKRFCENPKCKEAYRNIFRQRMLSKYGKDTLLRDPDHQKKMLGNRKISGIYVFQDGSKFSYVGSYELDFLEFLDLSLDWDTSDLMTPSPHIYHYRYENMDRFYIPDVYVPSLNVEIEIKDGGDNPNTHHKILDVDKIKETLKEEALKKTPMNYLKIPNKQNIRFIEFLREMERHVFAGEEKKIWMPD